MSVDVVGKSDFETQPLRVSSKSPKLILFPPNSHRKEAQFFEDAVMRMLEYLLPQSITLPNSTASHSHRPKVLHSGHLISKDVFLLNFYHVEEESCFVKPSLALREVVLCFQEVTQLGECSHTLTWRKRGLAL